MGYWFKGFFSKGDRSVLEAALNRWPFCTGKLIQSPFQGIGVRCPDPDRESRSGEYERLLEEVASFEDELPYFSALYPDLTFVFIHADCFGGTCIYTGYVARQGQIIERVATPRAGDENLQALLTFLDVRVVDGNFAPFQRDGWGLPGATSGTR